MPMSSTGFLVDLCALKDQSNRCIVRCVEMLRARVKSCLSSTSSLRFIAFSSADIPPPPKPNADPPYSPVEPKRRRRVRILPGAHVLHHQGFTRAADYEHSDQHVLHPAAQDSHRSGQYARGVCVGGRARSSRCGYCGDLRVLPGWFTFSV